MVVVVRFQGQVHCLKVSAAANDSLHELIGAQLNLNVNAFSLWNGSRPFSSDHEASDSDDPLTIHVKLLTLGGKGGFGSLLKRKGMKVKIHNFQSSRDLSGRRLRDVEAPEKARALARQRKWEEKLIMHLGGEDPCLGHKMTATECITTYKIRLSEQSTDPFEIIAQNTKTETPRHFTRAAASHADRVCAFDSPTKIHEAPQPLSASCLRDIELAVVDL